MSDPDRPQSILSPLVLKLFNACSMEKNPGHLDALRAALGKQVYKFDAAGNLDKGKLREVSANGTVQIEFSDKAGKPYVIESTGAEFVCTEEELKAAEL